MPLIPYADPGGLPDEARDTFEKLPRKLNIFRMWANAATCFRPGLSFGTAILTKQKLRPDLREMIILLVARLEGGIYEWVQHVPIGERAGCSKAQIAALEALRLDDQVFDADARAMLALVREVVRAVKASEAAAEAAKRHFSPQEMVEIVLTAGFYMTMARMTETLRVDVDAPPGVAVPSWTRTS
ncbi:MAG: carboxymuconolactone decarboxylase family protein [Alphaproteobacteria bacterium]|nr:carboxymuconolactone decarboxylase family protein [Alphaproteobacteria bacterium]MBV9694824.1 carboxymuconolactone decarboxylase family protein [Alphaproteobacteria bacterium]